MLLLSSICADQVWKYPVKEWWRPPPSSGDDFYAFTHGPVLVIVSNRPWLSFTKKFKVGDAAGGIPGNTEICNILVDCNDCGYQARPPCRLLLTASACQSVVLL